MKKVALCLALLATPACAQSRPDDALAARAVAIVKKHHLSSEPIACLGFVVNRSAQPGVDDVDVREIHNTKCGGDPSVEPRLFSLYFDQKTPRVAVDQPDGSLKVLR